MQDSFYYNIMSTYREITYLILDEMRAISDDILFNEDHIIFLINKYRNLILKQNYLKNNKDIPNSNYQLLSIDLEIVKGINGVDCSNTYLRSINTIPNLLEIADPKISSTDYFGSEMFTYVSNERIVFTGHNKFLTRVIYATLGPDNKLYLKSSSPQAYYLENVQLKGIFENPTEVTQYTVDGIKCDILDIELPLEEAFIPMLTEYIIKELTGALYKPEDDENNAKDDLANKISNNK